jgi:hypothetical protein
VVILVPADPSRFTDLPTNFAMDVRPPSTDLITWDRFVNGFGNGLAASRDGVFNGFLAEIARHVDQKFDITIDDPPLSIPVTTADSITNCSMKIRS